MYQVIGSDFCQYCEDAQRLLDERNLDYRYRKLNRFMSRYFKRKNLKTVPQVWHNGEYIGGYSELAEHLFEQDTVVHP